MHNARFDHNSTSIVDYGPVCLLVLTVKKKLVNGLVSQAFGGIPFLFFSIEKHSRENGKEENKKRKKKKIERKKSNFHSRTITKV